MRLRVEDIIEIARSASEIMFSESVPVIARRRSASDYTTRTDLQVEKYLISNLQELVPGSRVIAEESDHEDFDVNKAEAVFIIDPIDGTINFFHDYKASAVSIAYMEKGVPVVGVIVDPYKKEIFHAEREKGAYLNGNPVTVSEVTAMKDALAGFGTAPYNKEKGIEMLEAAMKVYGSCQDVRRLGAAALDLAHVACGRLDLFFEKELKPWDYYAGMLIVQEAGGKCTDWVNRSLNEVRVADICSSNGILHPEVLKLIGRL